MIFNSNVKVFEVRRPVYPTKFSLFKSAYMELISSLEESLVDHDCHICITKYIQHSSFLNDSVELVLKAAVLQND